jgi:hypothetical protein
MQEQSFIEMINNLFGGAVTTLIGAFTGRLMYHSGEVKLGRRRFFGKELLWEIPVAVGMAIIGDGIASSASRSARGLWPCWPISGRGARRRFWPPGWARRADAS